MHENPVVSWHLAQLNVARLVEPLDAAVNDDFVAGLGPINALAEASPGFVWRLVDESGASSSYVEVPEIDDPHVIVNYSIWTDVESLRDFVTDSEHRAYLRRRREWFERATEPSVVCWWVPAGERPPVGDALRRLEHLRVNGPSPVGWPLHRPLPPPADPS